jgi:ribosomal protein S18 acetylase RimI-like enzyme
MMDHVFFPKWEKNVNLSLRRKKTVIDPNSIEIRLVRQWKTTEIVELYRAGGWWKESDNPDELLPLMQGSLAFVIALNVKTNHLVGMGRVISDGISDGYLQDVIVLPEFRKLGIGKKIVTTLLHTCKEKNLTWVGLIAQPGMDHFYASLGFDLMPKHIPMIYRGDSE